MQTATRNRRRNEIMDVAIEVLAERGYRDTTMLDVARRASASKETLYAWFNDKRGLFAAIIRRNAEAVQQVLARHLEERAAPEDILTEFGGELLELLLSDRAIAVNRAAISEARSDPTLAQTLLSAGREATLPPFIQFLELHREQGTLAIDSPTEAAEDFLGLLLGDAQIRRLLGALPAPSKAEIEQRAARTTQRFLRLYSSSS